MKAVPILAIFLYDKSMTWDQISEINICVIQFSGQHKLFHNYDHLSAFVTVEKWLLVKSQNKGIKTVKVEFVRTIIACNGELHVLISFKEKHNKFSNGTGNK